MLFRHVVGGEVAGFAAHGEVFGMIAPEDAPVVRAHIVLLFLSLGKLSFKFLNFLAFRRCPRRIRLTLRGLILAKELPIESSIRVGTLTIPLRC